MDGSTQKTIARSTRQVIEDHLRKRVQNQLEEDLKANYSEAVVLLTCTGIYRGHAGVRESNEILKESLPNARIEYCNVLIENEFGFVEWRGFSDNVEVNEGADSFIVNDGKIIKQSIHYKIHKRSQE